MYIICVDGLLKDYSNPKIYQRYENLKNIFFKIIGQKTTEHKISAIDRHRTIYTKKNNNIKLSCNENDVFHEEIILITTEII